MLLVRGGKDFTHCHMVFWFERAELEGLFRVQVEV